MATMSTPTGKFKFDFIEPTTGEKFSEEPFFTSTNILDPNGNTSMNWSQAMIIDGANVAMNAVCSLTGASCIAKHIIYDQTLTD